jgi:hypothetical protein
VGNKIFYEKIFFIANPEEHVILRTQKFNDNLLCIIIVFDLAQEFFIIFQRIVPKKYIIFIV